MRISYVMPCHDGAATLTAARAWVANPDEDERVAALRAADAGDDEMAATWVARGAGWSGGSIVPDGPVPVSTYLATSETGRFVPLVRDADTGLPLIDQILSQLTVTTLIAVALVPIIGLWLCRLRPPQTGKTRQPSCNCSYSPHIQ